MPDRDEINEFLMGGGGKAFEFEPLGATVSGFITDMKKRQQSDMQTGKPAYWDNGDPKMMLQIVLQTELQDDGDDDGLRSVYLRGGNHTAVSGKGTSSLVAVQDAVKRSGSVNGIQVGGKLTLQYSGVGKSSSKGFNPPKLYVAAYEPADASISLDEMA